MFTVHALSIMLCAQSVVGTSQCYACGQKVALKEHIKECEVPLSALPFIKLAGKLYQGGKIPFWESFEYFLEITKEACKENVTPPNDDSAKLIYEIYTQVRNDRKKFGPNAGFDMFVAAMSYPASSTEILGNISYGRKHNSKASDNMSETEFLKQAGSGKSVNPDQDEGYQVDPDRRLLSRHHPDFVKLVEEIIEASIRR